MLLKHSHLLLGDKPLKLLPRLSLDGFQDLRVLSAPQNSLCQWEEVLHEPALAGKGDCNRAISKTRQTPPLDGRIHTINGLHRIPDAHKLDIGVLGFARRSLHNDMDRLVNIVIDLGITSKKSNDLAQFGGERNLKHN